ncbi:hypothetical protein RFH42_02890 [Acinetobacter rudis]|uniref:hypothetical protein n=1 Tax=Acinetobacter rudis TaxID=632955 RepID=UPI00280FBD61|nr:hypothetical protein [Acinetobacter rudis]MDQ8951903.1 hypothetical protein [Acinetobacter rudis]
MKIILIHGMNQQQFNATELKQYWLDILNQGIKSSKQGDQFKLDDLNMAFYADLLETYKLHNVLKSTRLLPQTWQFLNFNRPQTVLHDNPLHSTVCNPDFTQPTFNFSSHLSHYAYSLEDHILKDFTQLINHFPKLHGQLIHKFLIETYMYLANTDFNQKVHQRLYNCFDSQQQNLIIAHSLGTVIAYNFLRLNPQFKIHTLITLGSPLAFRVIQEKIIPPIQRPSNILGQWYNFYSAEDFLTAFPLQKAPFLFKPSIINQMIHTFDQRPHHIAGYLQHPDVIQCILNNR